MQFSTVFVAAFAALASASPAIVARGNSPQCLVKVGLVDDCGRQCILDSAAALNHVTYKQMCQDFTNVRAGASICVLTSCGVKTPTVLAQAEAACAVCINDSD